MIEINNLTSGSIEEKFLKRVAEIVLRGENKEGFNLSIVLVGQGRMRKLNKKYRKRNRVTDVLAFSQKAKAKFIKPLKEKQELGEIVICLREVKKNAKRYGSVLEKELVRVLIHGILHLLGYDHPDRKAIEDPRQSRDEKLETEAKKMIKKEEYYLSQT